AEADHGRRGQGHQQTEADPAWRPQKPVHDGQVTPLAWGPGYGGPTIAEIIDGGVKPWGVTPASPRRSTPDTALIGLGELPSPAKWNGLSGSAMNAAAARSGVMPTNQAARVSSVVPVLPPTGRPTAAATPDAVDQSPQLPVAAL